MCQMGTFSHNYHRTWNEMSETSKVLAHVICCFWAMFIYISLETYMRETQKHSPVKRMFFHRRWRQCLRYVVHCSRFYRWRNKRAWPRARRQQRILLAATRGRIVWVCRYAVLMVWQVVSVALVNLSCRCWRLTSRPWRDVVTHEILTGNAAIWTCATEASIPQTQRMMCVEIWLSSDIPIHASRHL